MKYNNFLYDARRRKKNKGGRRCYQNQQQQNFIARTTLPENKMSLIVSNRLIYILTKMSEEGNKIAKDFLNLLYSDEKRFTMSYFDITQKIDSLSYMSSSGYNVPESEKFSSNKRQFVQVYKVIKTIFGSKYTKNEVQKFISMFRSVYKKGPDRNDMPPPSVEKIIQKLLKDTKSGAMKWTVSKDLVENDKMVRYQTRSESTPNKGIVFDIYIFKKKENCNLSFLTIHFYNKTEKTHIHTCDIGKIRDLVDYIIDKHKIDVEK